MPAVENIGVSTEIGKGVLHISDLIPPRGRPQPIPPNNGCALLVVFKVGWFLGIHLDPSDLSSLVDIIYCSNREDDTLRGYGAGSDGGDVHAHAPNRPSPLPYPSIPHRSLRQTSVVHCRTWLALPWVHVCHDGPRTARGPPYHTPRPGSRCSMATHLRKRRLPVSQDRHRRQTVRRPASSPRGCM